MSLENPLWGATKLHGELLKLGIEVAHRMTTRWATAPALDTAGAAVRHPRAQQ